MIVSVNFSYALFFHLHFLTFEEEAVGCPEMLVRNYHSLLNNISEYSGSLDDLAMKAVVLTVHHPVQSGWVSCSPLLHIYANLRQPHIL